MTVNILNRREILMGTTAAATALAATRPAVAAPKSSSKVSGIEWVSTTQHSPWRTMPTPALQPLDPNLFGRDLEVKIDTPLQTISGFGGAFTEKGWDALSALPAHKRNEAVAALFGASGAAFNLCRTPIGANDISRKWYSYNETDGDFAMANFSVDNDRDTLIPYIRAAMARQPNLKIWASPWSPPTWMKTGKHYAQAPAWPGQPSNGILPDQHGKEGVDSFIQEDRYFAAYARYFRRYVEEYAKAGVPISMVMPQNEFNSAQPFPSCCWTPEGLARFIPYLGKEMGQLGVDIFFGTLERPNAELLSKVLANPKSAAYIKGVGVQWAGKGALSEIQRRHPDLTVWGSEQECGIGTNDWRYARYSWGVIKQYFLNGAGAWHYWNMVMPTGGLSGWGWPQNSLITVDTKRGSYRFNHEYYLMRHLSGFIRSGARRLTTDSFLGFENQLAFRNPDGSIVIVIQNEMAEPQLVRMKIGEKQLNVTLPADSFNTIQI
jgi:glucosylceramidase